MSEIDISPTITEIEVRFIAPDYVYVYLKTEKDFDIGISLSIELAKKLGLIPKELQI